NRNTAERDNGLTNGEAEKRRRTTEKNNGEEQRRRLHQARDRRLATPAVAPTEKPVQTQTTTIRVFVFARVFPSARPASRAGRVPVFSVVSPLLRYSVCLTVRSVPSVPFAPSPPSRSLRPLRPVPSHALELPRAAPEQNRAY